MARYDWEYWRSQYITGDDSVTLAFLSSLPGSPSLHRFKMKSREQGWTRERFEFRRGVLEFKAKTLNEDGESFKMLISAASKIVRASEPRAPRQASSPEISWVYFILDEDAKRVKIGYSTNPMKRLKNLQTGASGTLRLVCATPGGAKLEAYFHEQFSPYRVNGEWFKLQGTLALLVDLISLK